MTIKLHDTRMGKKVAFEPIDDEKVTMYLCGPTVYNYAHIGNARPAVVFDLLARVLRRRYELKFARNFTDVDDKINAASLETGKPIGEITDKFMRIYNEDMAALGVLPPDVEPRATEHIAEMVAMIETLIERGHAYAADGHVLFSVSDNGIGIAPENIPRLSERFYRVDVGRSRQSGGTGLGLAIVKHLMTRHGGYLEIHSELGKGSPFICHFIDQSVVTEPQSG